MRLNSKIRSHGGIGKLFGISIFLIMVMFAVLAPLISPYPPGSQDLSVRLLPPFSGNHYLGTDYLGRDILSRIIWGSRVSLTIGLLGALLGAIVGVFFGLISGFYGGWVDTIIMRLGDVQLAFPFILIAIAIMSVLGSGLKNMILIAVISGWVKYARVVRADVLTVREEEYVQAGLALGMSNTRLLVKHILPNVFSPVIIIATLETGRIIIMEATLTFLGLGIPPSIPTWGTMLSDGRMYMQSAPWLTVSPGIAIMLTVLGVNMLGDWLRDYLDPRMYE